MQSDVCNVLVVFCQFQNGVFSTSVDSCQDVHVFFAAVVGKLFRRFVRVRHHVPPAGRRYGSIARHQAPVERPATAEQIGERGAEGAAHAAVDEEVGRVAEQDDEIAHERRDCGGVALEDEQLERVLDDEKDQRHGLGKFDGEKHSDDRHQHQRRAASFSHDPASTTTTTKTGADWSIVIVVEWTGQARRGREKTTFAFLGTLHRADEKIDKPKKRKKERCDIRSSSKSVDEKNSEDDEQGARNQMYEDYTEPVNDVEVRLNTDTISHEYYYHYTPCPKKACSIL